MSDVPAEIAGALDFLDRARRRELIADLGLGVVPAWLLRHADVERIDVVELDADVIALVAGGPEPGWWRPTRACTSTMPTRTPGPRPKGSAGTARSTTSGTWSATGTSRRCATSPGVTAPGVGWSMCWERAECLAQVRRGATAERPGCRLPDWA
jgi:hypothetical protein